MHPICRPTTWGAVLWAAALSACSSTEPSQPVTPFFAYSAIEWAPETGSAQIDIRNRSGVRLAVEGCPSLQMRTAVGGWIEAPRSEEQSCIWPVFLVQPDSSLAFDIDVSALTAECDYRLALRVAIPPEWASEKVHTGDLTFENLLSPDLCVQ